MNGRKNYLKMTHNLTTEIFPPAPHDCLYCKNPMNWQCGDAVRFCKKWMYEPRHNGECVKKGKTEAVRFFFV